MRGTGQNIEFCASETKGITINIYKNTEGVSIANKAVDTPLSILGYFEPLTLKNGKKD